MTLELGRLFLRAVVRSTAPMTWRREAPMQRSSPAVRVWRATRAVKVVAMTMADTTAHTGASRFRSVAIMVPPDWEAAALWATAVSASTTEAAG